MRNESSTLHQISLTTWNIGSNKDVDVCDVENAISCKESG